MRQHPDDSSTHDVKASAAGRESTPPDSPEQAPFPEYFTAQDAGNDWHLTCRTCRRRWALAKTSQHAGNKLALLNHALSHKANRGGAR